MVFSFFKQIVEGMCKLQEHEIIHRDIKPENILLDETQKVIKIADFGQAVEYSLMKTLDQGTPLYMAPEVLNPTRSKSLRDKRIDVWSVGLVLCEMLLGKNIFEDDIKLNNIVDASTFREYIEKRKIIGFEKPIFPEEFEPFWTNIRKRMLEYNIEDRIYFHSLMVDLIVYEKEI